VIPTIGRSSDIIHTSETDACGVVEKSKEINDAPSKSVVINESKQANEAQLADRMKLLSQKWQSEKSITVGRAYAALTICCTDTYDHLFLTADFCFARYLSAPHQYHPSDPGIPQKSGILYSVT
jgi:hypothetical protein